MTIVIFSLSSIEKAAGVGMAYLLEKRRSALPIPKKTGRLTMATFLLSLRVAMA